MQDIPADSCQCHMGLGIINYHSANIMISQNDYITSVHGTWTRVMNSWSNKALNIKTLSKNWLVSCPILVELLIPCMKDEINIIHLFNTGN